MPVPRFERREELVKYVVVERTEEDSEAQEMQFVPSAPTPTTFANLSDDQLQPQPTVLRIRDDDSDSDSDDETSMPEMFTLTVMGAQSTGALAANDPAATAVVIAAPPPPPPKSDNGGHKGHISQTTEHLLIAAGSIGATIIIVMVILALYAMRKRGLTLAQALKQGKQQVIRRGPPPPPKYSPPRYQNEWDTKQPYNSSNYGSLRSNTVTPPQAAMSRSASFKSQQTSLTLGRSDSFNMQSDQTKYTGNSPGTFMLQSAPPRRNNSNRSPSGTPSSDILGQQDPRRSDSTRNTRSVEDGSASLYTDTTPDPRSPPMPPPPTFKQFLNNRPSISGKAGLGGMLSRFSWTNSQAPQTPNEANRETYQPGRDSYMTSRSSVPRFRTVDSWVNQQSNRIEAQKLKEQFRLTSTSTVYSQDDELSQVPEVPAMPKNVDRLRESSAPMSAALPARAPASPPLPFAKGLPGKNIRHERHDTRTTVDTEPIFKAHPGDEVRFSTRSTVPSEILDRGRNDNVLS